MSTLVQHLIAWASFITLILVTLKVALDIYLIRDLQKRVNKLESERPTTGDDTTGHS